MTSTSPALSVQLVQLPDKSLDAYAPIVGNDVIASLRELARPLRGARVAHVSATAQGGGVAELLHTLVPLMRGVGLETQWYVISGTNEFFSVTKSVHNALQGMPLSPLSTEKQETYIEVNRANAESLTDDFDFIVVHDPQPAPLRSLRSKDSGCWIWRSHIDMTSPNRAYWDYLHPFLSAYDAAVFTMPSYVPAGFHIKTAIIPPAIDPLSPKNVPMGEDEVRRMVAARGVDPARPMMVQVSRFDRWKDPLGVIDTYREVCRQVPDLQVVLMGAPASDDPEGSHYYDLTRGHTNDDPDIHVLVNEHGPREVNAFQRAATVVLQKSLREGFALTVTEALWKARPVVGGNVGGIPLQIQNGQTGYLVGSVQEAAARVADVLRHPEAAAAMGQRAREEVREKFLSTAQLGNYLRLFNSLKG